MYTILCVDDHVATLHSLCLILQFAGYNCLTAENAQDADRLFRKHPIDLVIVDHGLPGMDGTTLAGHFKSIKDVQVLMLTGNPNQEREPNVVNLLIQKPYPPRDLLESIAEILPPKNLSGAS